MLLGKFDIERQIPLIFKVLVMIFDKSILTLITKLIRLTLNFTEQTGGTHYELY